jgi:hypothetical protein
MQLEAEKVGAEYHFTDPEEAQQKKAYIFSDVSIKYYWEHSVSEIIKGNSEIDNW